MTRNFAQMNLNFLLIIVHKIISDRSRIRPSAHQVYYIIQSWLTYLFLLTLFSCLLKITSDICTNQEFIYLWLKYIHSFGLHSLLWQINPQIHHCKTFPQGNYSWRDLFQSPSFSITEQTSMCFHNNHQRMFFSTFMTSSKSFNHSCCHFFWPLLS